MDVDIAIDRTLVLQTRRSIEDSRRWLDAYHRRNIPKPALIKCLLCGEEGYDFHHVVFQARSLESFQRQYPSTNLNAHLADFGVCPDCVQLYQGKRKRVIFALNHAITNEPRILH